MNLKFIEEDSLIESIQADDCGVGDMYVEDDTLYIVTYSEHDGHLVFLDVGNPHKVHIYELEDAVKVEVLSLDVRMT